MRIHPVQKSAQKRGGKSKTAKTPPLPEHVVPASPRRMPMPPMPTGPTRQPRRIPGKGGR